jgi:hypothetical protein
MLRRRSTGKKVQAAAGKEDGIDIGHRNELLQHQRLVPCGPEFLQLVGFHDDVLARRVFISAFDRFGWNRAVARTLLLVADALTASDV